MCLRVSWQGLLIHSVAEKAGSWAVQAEKCSHSSSWSSASVTTARAFPALKNSAFRPHLLPGAWLVFMFLLWFCLTRVVACQDVAGKPGIWMTLAHSYFPHKLSLHLFLLLSLTHSIICAFPARGQRLLGSWQLSVRCLIASRLQGPQTFRSWARRRRMWSQVWIMSSHTFQSAYGCHSNLT